MRVVVKLDIPDLDGAPPPYVRLRRAIKYLLRSHRIRVRSIKPVKEKAA